MFVVLSNHKKGERPYINLSVRRVTCDVWYSLGFYKHHYLTHDLSKSCLCLLFEWNNQAVAFVGLKYNPTRGIPYNMNVSRIVVLPDFQGLGLSSMILNFVGGICSAKTTKGSKHQLCIKTAHEKMGNALSHNNKWIGTGRDMKVFNQTSDYRKTHRTCVSFCKKYIGVPIYGYDNLLKPIDEMKSNRFDSLAKQYTLW